MQYNTFFSKRLLYNNKIRRFVQIYCICQVLTEYCTLTGEEKMDEVPLGEILSIDNQLAEEKKYSVIIFFNIIF